MAEDPTHSADGHRGLITVFGGTGFLGRRIVRHLLDHGFKVRAASRHPERVGSASRADAGPETAKADIHDETTVAAALFGAYGAVNAVSLYVERGRATFDAVHVEAAARVARLARASGVERLIHVSGIGADPVSSAPYIASRGRGELAVQQGFPGAILIRPAVMFGPDDAFLTTVARLLSTAWLLCLPVGQALPLASNYRSTLFFFRRGTNGSNPFPSSGKSANHRFLRGLHSARFRRLN